jgi:glycosyltransferase involved in cell wall biosynthesis
LGRILLRIAILGPAPPDRGGIAHETARLAEDLARLAEVEYLTFSRAYPRWLDPRRFAHDPRLTAAPATPVLDYLSVRSWRDTAERIRRFGARALIVPWWTSFWGIPVRAVFRRLAKIAPDTLRILLCHNLEDHEGGLVQRFLALGAFGMADRFVAHNEENRRELGRRFPGRPAIAVPLPAPPPAADRAAARRDLGIRGRLVLFLGLVRRYKGVDVLLEAAPRIVAETSASIAVVGEVFADAGPVRERWAASPVRDRIHWKDEYVSEEEMARWLAASDVLVLPYREISSSAIAARGIGALRPLAASAVGGLAEVVVPGQTGELFAPGDSRGLASAVARIFERGEESYRPGLERAAREMAWPKYVEKIVEFLEMPRDSGLGTRDSKSE